MKKGADSTGEVKLNTKSTGATGVCDFGPTYGEEEVDLVKF